MNISVAQLKHALMLREQIETLSGEFDALMSGGLTTSAAPANRRGRPPMSDAARAKKSEQPAAVAAKARGTRKMSAAARAKISAAAKARWAKVKAGKGKTLAGA